MSTESKCPHFEKSVPLRNRESDLCKVSFHRYESSPRGCDHHGHLFWGWPVFIPAQTAERFFFVYSGADHGVIGRNGYQNMNTKASRLNAEISNSFGRLSVFYLFQSLFRQSIRSCSGGTRLDIKYLNPELIRTSS